MRIILGLAVTLIIFVFTLGCQKEAEKSILKGMVYIAAGKFTMGSNEVDTEMLQQRFGMRDIPYQNEHPLRKIQLDDYYIDKYEVSNKQYKVYLDYAWKNLSMTVYKQTLPEPWKNRIYAKGKDNFPVTSVSWHNANNYCLWLGKRLPTEVEWEKAAKGESDDRKFPWGDVFDNKKTNSMGLNGGTAPVGKYKGDVSPFGVHDMAGNVSEWVADWYQPYPGNKYQSNAYGEKFKVARGWHWGGFGHYILELFYRNSFRIYWKPNETRKFMGFRCAYSQ